MLERRNRFASCVFAVWPSLCGSNLALLVALVAGRFMCASEGARLMLRPAIGTWQTRALKAYRVSDLSIFGSARESNRTVESFLLAIDRRSASGSISPNDNTDSRILVLPIDSRRVRCASTFYLAQPRVLRSFFALWRAVCTLWFYLPLKCAYLTAGTFRDTKSI